MITSHEIEEVKTDDELRRGIFKEIITSMKKDKVELHFLKHNFIFYILEHLKEDGSILDLISKIKKFGLIDDFSAHLKDEVNLEQIEEHIQLPFKINNGIYFHRLSLHIFETTQPHQYDVNEILKKIKRIGEDEEKIKNELSRSIQSLKKIYGLFWENRASYLQEIQTPGDLQQDLFEISILDLYSFFQNFYSGNYSNAAWCLQQHQEKLLKKLLILKNNMANTPCTVKRTHNLKDILGQLNCNQIDTENLINTTANDRYQQKYNQEEIFAWFEKYISFLNEIEKLDIFKEITKKQPTYKSV